MKLKFFLEQTHCPDTTRESSLSWDRLMNTIGSQKIFVILPRKVYMA